MENKFEFLKDFSGDIQEAMKENNITVEELLRHLEEEEHKAIYDMVQERKNLKGEKTYTLEDLDRYIESLKESGLDV